MATIETIETIGARHPVRNVFAGCSTGAGLNSYFETKGQAVNSFDANLQRYDIWLDRNDVTGYDGDNGRKTVAVVNEFERVVGYAVFSWYRMPSGRYEFTGYLA